MNFGADWTRIQQIADHRMARKTLRGVAIGSLIWGGLVLAIGLIPPPDLISIALASVLLATGSWNLSRPKPAGIVIDGITICLIGVYNLSAVFTGETGAGLWARLGVFQLIWGVGEILRFGKFRKALAFEPQDTELRAMEDFIRPIEKGKTKESPDLIDFMTTGLQAQAWRARLMQDGAMLVKRRSNEVIMVRRHEVDIQPGRKVLFGKELNATFAINGKTHKGAISPEALERFQHWKYGTEVPAALAA